MELLAGFTGKLYLDGREATTEDAVILQQNMCIPDRLHPQIHTCGALALAAAVHYQENNTNICNEGNRVLVAAGSVYNRDTLCEKLQFPIDAKDSEFIWNAWQKWGEDAPQRIDGDWMFAAYDLRKDELLLARSWGHSSLYFYRGHDFIVFSTHPTSLTELPYVPSEPDINTITRMLCAMPSSPDATFWRGIYQLQPAAKMVIRNGKVGESIWWRPSRIKQIKIDDEKTAIDKFVTLYERAVNKRLRTSKEVGATLSAGLDSSSVCILAARSMSGELRTLHTWTSVPRYPDEAFSFGNWLTDETGLAARIAAKSRNIKHNIVNSANENPIDSIRRQILHTGRPQASIANQYWIDSILELAAIEGCEVLLTGQFGNSTVSWSPHKISLFPKGRYFPDTSLKSYMGLMKRKLINNVKYIRKSIYSQITGKKPKYPLINPEYAAGKAFRRCIDEDAEHRVINHAGTAEVNMGLFDTWYHNSLWSGVEVRDPTMDVELTEFLLTLPYNMFFRDGVDRRIMRLGMQGILSDEIRLNKRRGQQASDIVPRVRTCYESVEQAMEYVETSALSRELLNTEKMKFIMQKIINGETGYEIMKECSRILLPGLSAGLFLASFDTGFDLSESLVCSKK